MAKIVEVSEVPMRRAKGSRPPKIDLGVAVELITEVYETAGGTTTFDELSEIMRNSRSSSAFKDKLAALRSFGLVETENERLSLSPTAERIVAPEDPEAKTVALKDAFLAVEPFAITFEKYVGKILPQEEFLKNSFNEYGRDVAETWMRRFKASAEAAGLLMDRGDGKLQVRESGKSAMRLPSPPKGEPPAESAGSIELPMTRLSAIASGGGREVAKTEYQMLIEILDAKMTSEEQAAVWTLIQYLKKREAGAAASESRTEPSGAGADE